MNIIKPSSPMRSSPYDESELETECLYGEKVKIVNENGDWIYCQLLTDNYLGWVKKDNLGFLKKPTHRIIVKRSFLYEQNNSKSNCLNYLPLGAKININDINGKWAKTEIYSKSSKRFAYIPIGHLVKLGDKIDDWVSIAENLLDTPYKWGGRDTLGIDCSALIQLSYEAYGQIIPRNTNEQVKINMKTIKNLNNLSRGCVVYWEGHVGLMVDNLNCIHANGFHMKTVIEPLNIIIARMNNSHKLVKIMNFNI